MTETDLAVLKAHIDKVVKIIARDGEQFLARIHAISDEDADVIYDLVSGHNQSDTLGSKREPAYLIKFQEIDRVEPGNGD
jgi:hypothetical protein